TTAAGNIGQDFGQASINGVFSLTDALVSIPPSTRNRISPVIPPVVLGMADLAVTSIALLVFIGGLYHLRGLLAGRIALGAWVLALFLFLFIVGMVSVGMFVLINQSATSGNLGDWLDLLNTTNSSYVAIDTANTTSDAQAAMANCSANISAQLGLRFNHTKSVTVFTYAGQSCDWNGQSNWTYDQCLAQTRGAPIMFLHYNATSAAPRFSVVFAKQADAWYSTADYQKCEIGDVLN
ncbi:MAG: hypothetical protein KGH63_01560, partial [Candidatus Micrarchaeota archaeon]|nr:hypothetical protein [Candidatus Micrarchaeota archaeon]